MGDWQRCADFVVTTFSLMGDMDRFDRTETDLVREADRRILLLHEASLVGEVDRRVEDCFVRRRCPRKGEERRGESVVWLGKDVRWRNGECRFVVGTG